MTTCVISRWVWRVSAAVWLAGCGLGAAALLPETVALVESFSGRIAVLPGLPHEDWTTTPAGTALVASGLRTHLRALTPEQFADTNYFNAQRFPVALYLGGEPY